MGSCTGIYGHVIIPDYQSLMIPVLGALAAESVNLNEALLQAFY
jgi:hypothetical protein